jgi:hypothetical protein
MKFFPVFAGLALLAGASESVAQERGVARREFPFFDHHLTIEVEAEMPGKLQVVRGEIGRIEAAGRVPGGIATFALGGREGDRLRVSALGGEQADFVVVVPEDASVRVRLPNRDAHQVNTLSSGGTYSWRGKQAPRNAAAASLPAPATSTVAYSNIVSPRVLNVAKLNSVRTINVRFEGPTFSVAGTQWMSVKSGNPNHVEVQPGADIQDVTIQVPLGTRTFELRLGGRLALTLNAGEIRAFCEPVTEQQLSEGRRWYTFTTNAGPLTCR